MKNIKTNIFLFAMMAAAPLTAGAQTADDADSTVVKKKVHVAFRDVDADHLLGGVSYIDMEELSKKDYMQGSLEDALSLIGGLSSNNMSGINLWGMDNDRLDNNDNTNMPLVIIDGVKRPSNNVLPSEIEQITFLKGAQAVVLYGAKGAKGAIVITTKRGKVDGLQVDVNANTGWHFAKEFPQYLGSAEYMTLYNEATYNDAVALGNTANYKPAYSQQDIYNHAIGANPYRYPNVNYYSDEYIRKAYNRSEGTVEIQGGGTRAHFYTNINYYRAEDLINFGKAKDNYTDRFSVRGNVDLVVNKFITGWANVSATYYNEYKNKGDFWSDAATMRPNFPLNAAPLIPISMVDPNASKTLATLGKSLNLLGGQWFPGGGTDNAQSNAIADCYFGGETQKVSRQFQFDAGVNYDMNHFVKGLTFKTLFSIDYAASYDLAYNNTYSLFFPTWSNYNTVDAIVDIKQPKDEVVTGTMTMSNQKYRQTITWNGHFDYDHTFAKKHHVTGMLLASMYTTTASGTYHRYANANLGLQAGYDFMGRYFFDMSLAGVHSARLPEGNREAISHAFTIGWNIAKEKFLKGSFIDDLLISASLSNLNDDADVYYTGSKYNDYYLYDAVWTNGSPGYSWNEGANSSNATVSTSGSNPALDYIHRKEFSLSLRASFFNKLLSAELTYFNTDMDGYITQNPTMYPSHLKNGLSSGKFSPTINNNISNRKGLDFNIKAQKQFGEVHAALGLSGTYLKTEWKKYDETADPKSPWLNSSKQLMHEGTPLDAILGYRCLGFYTIDDFNVKTDPETGRVTYELKELKEGVKSPYAVGGTVMPGDLKYEDVNGDGKINNLDQVELGKSGLYGAPWTIGVNLTLKYKNWTLFVLGNGQFGAYAMANGSYYYMSGTAKYSENVRDHFQYTYDDKGIITGFVNPNASHPRLAANNAASNGVASTYWMYSTDRFNLRKIQLTYDFPKEMFEGKWVKALSVYVSGNDLLTISKNRKIMETAVGYAPQTRFYNLGVKVTL
jgi:TonB-linked SusC/RagA family outer membrane protein